MSIYHQTDGLYQEPSWNGNCKHPDHHPTYDRKYVPQTSTYTHVCPACGYSIVLNTYNMREVNEN